MPLATLSFPGQLQALLTSGLGGGAIAVPLIGMAGGVALSARVARSARIACGILALSIVPAWAAAAPMAGGDAIAVTTARGAWTVLLFYSLLAVLALACAIPLRPGAAAHAAPASISGRSDARR